ncbi:conserved hypothetical protein [Leishmania major strain Friedlin]|uniref:Uncharacterized protein n=1 Tax=Leishmania major TaxID=5664 RepID=Q4Q0Q9_LEIMA|nr:conserved hypothetical protein [Leishmania major strain Friedlin]CAG9584055.1 hypothetical_protein_-_conserved [Leishmania major strain Friedlin]CAJ09475.1 conserved hypothetical protein [Leishmania major strain Friedlin]|eukprot:XP_001687089.1 conserved hypothetical protein [Leishmania major strain Friedlin]
MSALNDSRTTSGRPLPGGKPYALRPEGIPPSLCGDNVGASRGGDSIGDFKTAFEQPHSIDSEEEGDVEAASSPEQRLRRVQRDVYRHERQIASLFSEKHEHCEHLATVYKELEKVLRKIQLAPLEDLKGHAASPSASTFCAPSSDEDGYAASSTVSALASSLQQRFHQVLQQHQDRVYDVLVDYRQQINKSEYETGRRLCAIEEAIAQIQSDVRELQHTASIQVEELRHVQQDVRQRVEAVAVQQEAQRAALDATREARDTKAAKLLSKIQDDVAGLRADAKAARTQQIESAKDVEEQIRSLLSAQHRTEEALGAHSASIAQLQNQDSLEGAFHEVKDWLGDLEKRMVSRGELLQWTASLQSEIHQMRRVTGGVLSHTIEPTAPGQDA